MSGVLSPHVWRSDGYVECVQENGGPEDGECLHVKRKQRGRLEKSTGQSHHLNISLDPTQCDIWNI